MKLTMEYTVELSIQAQRPLTLEALEGVAAIGGAAGGKVGGDRLTTTLTVDAKDLSAAVAAAAKRVMKIVPGDLLAAAAATCEEFDRQAEERTAREELVGIGEIAAMLKISKQRVTTLSKRSDFPSPVQRLAAGPIYRKSDLSTFADGWQRKAGRPRADSRPVASAVSART